ncbi:MAG: hypothetical protein JST00_33140 [Deltaproteobacteria bacterium]|nr:hypothetical protein [Deltaproteobacteria bacterium]
MSDEAKGESTETIDEELTPEQLAALENDAPIASLLKKSLAPPPAAEPEKDQELLASVQRKLRQRSKGKFYADGWSTSQSRLNYGLIAGVMLVVIVAVYLALGPMGISLH